MKAAVLVSGLKLSLAFFCPRAVRAARRCFLKGPALSRTAIRRFAPCGFDNLNRKKHHRQRNNRQNNYQFKIRIHYKYLI